MMGHLFQRHFGVGIRRHTRKARRRVDDERQSLAHFRVIFNNGYFDGQGLRNRRLLKRLAMAKIITTSPLQSHCRLVKEKMLFVSERIALFRMVDRRESPPGEGEANHVSICLASLVTFPVVPSSCERP